MTRKELREWVKQAQESEARAQRAEREGYNQRLRERLCAQLGRKAFEQAGFEFDPDVYGAWLQVPRRWLPYCKRTLKVVFDWDGRHLEVKRPWAYTGKTVRTAAEFWLAVEELR